MNNPAYAMSDKAIQSELEMISWEYIVAADKAQNDKQYETFCAKIKARKAELESELNKRNAGELLAERETS